MKLSATLIGWLCDPARQEELAGDLEELRARRSERHGARYAASRGWLDLLSVCLRQSRMRSWTPKQWVLSGLLVATLAAGSLPADDGLPTGPYGIAARDAAGAFTLKLRQGRVLEATLDEQPFPLARVMQSGARITLLGAGPRRQGRAGDLEITLTPEGGIRWAGRPAPDPGAPAPIDLTLAQEYVAELATASAVDDGKLWGVRLYGPLLLVDPGSRFVAANRLDSAGVLTRSDGLFTGSWPAEQPISNTAMRWGGERWTMIMWPLPSDGYARRRLAFHEMFHRIEPELGIILSDAVNEHLATRDGRIWTRLEWRALGEALIRKGSERSAALEDALLFRGRRRSLFPNAAAEERALELNEGLAEYTGLKLSGLPAELLADRAAVELANREQQDSYSRSFAYASGPAYGVLLDERGVSWRRGLTSGSDLSELLRKAYGFSVDPAGRGAEQRALRYGGRRIIAQESARAERIAATEARLKAQLVDGPTLTLPASPQVGYSFDPTAVTPLPGIGTTYESAKITDGWGILTVNSGGVLLVRSGVDVVRVVVPVPANAPNPPIAGEGWKLELAAGWAIERSGRTGSWEVRRR